MSNAIRDGIRPPMGNSLSPEPCALIPSTEGPSMTSGSSPSRPGWMVDGGLLVAGLMDGGYAGMRGAW